MTELTDKALERLREFEPATNGLGYYLAFSGGKDSCVLLELAKMSGVAFDAHYNLTTIDPPELVHFIKQHHPTVKINRPEQPMLNKLRVKGMPNRRGRWCCEFLKERGGEGRLVLTGVRWAESAQRAKRHMVEACYKGRGKRYLHPIIDWSEKDVWAFIRERKLPYCRLYDEGWKRIGCLFCPIASAKQKAKEKVRYPRHVRLFVKAFDALKANREKQGLTSCDRWPDGAAMFDWWISNKSVAEYQQDEIYKDPIFQ